MFYVLVRGSINEKPSESEYNTEAEALAEAVHCLKQGSIVEIVEE